MSLLSWRRHDAVLKSTCYCPAGPRVPCGPLTGRPASQHASRFLQPLSEPDNKPLVMICTNRREDSANVERVVLFDFPQGSRSAAQIRGRRGNRTVYALVPRRQVTIARNVLDRKKTWGISLHCTKCRWQSTNLRVMYHIVFELARAMKETLCIYSEEGFF
jgi:hypothetical protein